MCVHTCVRACRFFCTYACMYSCCFFFWQGLTCACALSHASSAAQPVMLSGLMPRGNTELAGLPGCPLTASSLHASSWECKHVTLGDLCLYVGTCSSRGLPELSQLIFLHAASIKKNKTPGRKLAATGQACKSYSYPAR